VGAAWILGNELTLGPATEFKVSSGFIGFSGLLGSLLEAPQIFAAGRDLLGTAARDASDRRTGLSSEPNKKSLPWRDGLCRHVERSE
jgi:hypothetical protein